MRTKCRFASPQSFMLGQNLVFRFFDVISIGDGSSRTNFATSHWDRETKGRIFYSATNPSTARDRIIHTTELAPYTDVSEVAKLISERASKDRYSFKAIVSEPPAQVTSLVSKAMYPVLVGQSTGSNFFFDMYYTDKLEYRDKILVDEDAGELPFNNVVVLAGANVRELFNSQLFDTYLYSVMEDMVYVRD